MEISNFYRYIEISNIGISIYQSMKCRKIDVSYRMRVCPPPLGIPALTLNEALSTNEAATYLVPRATYLFGFSLYRYDIEMSSIIVRYSITTVVRVMCFSCCVLPIGSEIRYQYKSFVIFIWWDYRSDQGGGGKYFVLP